MFKTINFFVIFLFICLIRCEEDENNDVFVPTKDWKVVKKGQKIPKGLHVRINLETGLIEAKLLDETSNAGDKTNALSSLPQESELEANIDEKTVPRSRLEEAVKNIKGDDVLDPDEIKKIKDKFRSYDEIKKTLSQLNLTPKSDAEVITELLKKHKEILTAGKLNKVELLKVIEDLDYLAHQYDNAREFVNQNGFHEIIYKNLNSTIPEVRKESLKLMSSIMQNNAVPKILALETGAIGVLLRLINFDSDSVVKTRALSALGALLRSFPLAQKKFIANGGLMVLSKFFETDNVNIQVKIVTLVSDLLVEHKWAFYDEKLNKYYTSFDLTQHVLEHNWCEHLNTFLYRLIIMDKDDHDAIEKCLTAMHSLRTNCGEKYNQDILVSLQKRYEILSLNGQGKSENDDFGDTLFFTVLKELCDEILHYVYKNSVKTEL